jgi:hypothetical protein
MGYLMPKLASEMNHLRAPLNERWRKRISEANILDRLLQHFAGTLKPPLTASQVQVGLKLVSKVMPDLKAVEVKGYVAHLAMNRQELENRLTALGYSPDEVWDRLEGKTQQKQQVIESDGKDTDTKSVDQDTQVIDMQGEKGT